MLGLVFLFVPIPCLPASISRNESRPVFSYSLPAVPSHLRGRRGIDKRTEQSGKADGNPRRSSGRGMGANFLIIQAKKIKRKCGSCEKCLAAGRMQVSSAHGTVRSRTGLYLPMARVVGPWPDLPMAKVDWLRAGRPPRAILALLYRSLTV